MNKISKLKFLSVGFMAGAIFFGGISYAATVATKIDVFFQPLKLFTIPIIPYEYEPFGLVWSAKVGHELERDLREQAYSWNADAIIGMAFQSIGSGSLDGSSTDGNGSVSGETTIYSICYGTAIRYAREES